MNTNPQHTPGPWVAYDRQIVIPSKRGVDHLIAETCGNIRTVERDRANAHLIAAAPDLFNVLQSLAYRLSDFDGDEQIDGGDTVDVIATLWPDIKAALAKAQGNTTPSCPQKSS